MKHRCGSSWVTQLWCDVMYKQCFCTKKSISLSAYPVLDSIETQRRRPGRAQMQKTPPSHPFPFLYILPSPRSPLNCKEGIPGLVSCIVHSCQERVPGCRVAEDVRGHGEPRRKLWTRTKILSPNIRYFVANKDFSRFTHFLEIFGQRKCLFGSKTVFLGQEVHYYMVYIAYFIVS